MFNVHVSTISTVQASFLDCASSLQCTSLILNFLLSSWDSSLTTWELLADHLCSDHWDVLVCPPQESQHCQCSQYASSAFPHAQHLPRGFWKHIYFYFNLNGRPGVKLVLTENYLCILTSELSVSILAIFCEGMQMFLCRERTKISFLPVSLINTCGTGSWLSAQYPISILFIFQLRELCLPSSLANVVVEEL